MDIMKNLGFSRRGTENQNDMKTDYEFHFSDKYPRKEGETCIYNLIILDESGSMSPLRAEALSGANETLQTIRTAQQEHPDDNQMVSFVTFDSGSSRPDVRALIDNEKIENVKDITPEQYQPWGGTPLYDAMGLSITALRDLVKEGDHVLVTVITDGYENSSEIFSAEMIKELVDSLSTKGWVFTYIGANQDSEQTAGGLGIHSTMDFKATVVGSAVMWDRMNSSRREYYKNVRRNKASGIEMECDKDFFATKQALTRITPERIDTLKEGEIFVFGSNEAGQHLGGAARAAVERFGAVFGQGSGLQGRSYAIPTLRLPGGGPANRLSLQAIRGYVQEFIYFADAHPELTFLVTRIGCGIAGFHDEEIAPLFAGAYSLPNVYLPASFWKVLSYQYKD